MMLRGALGLTTLAFIAGIFLPLITISKFLVINDSLSIVSGVIELLRSGHPFLFLLILLFSILLPALKIGILFALLANQGNHKTRRYLEWMHEYGRWAMLDVMVVALLIVTVKLGVIASVEGGYA